MVTDRGDLWALVLQAEDADDPHVGRMLARLVKTLGRGYGLRCVKVGGAELLAEETPADPVPSPSSTVATCAGQPRGQVPAGDETGGECGAAVAIGTSTCPPSGRGNRVDPRRPGPARADT